LYDAAKQTVAVHDPFFFFLMPHTIGIFFMPSLLKV